MDRTSKRHSLGRERRQKNIIYGKAPRRCPLRPCIMGNLRSAIRYAYTLHLAQKSPPLHFFSPSFREIRYFTFCARAHRAPHREIREFFFLQPARRWRRHHPRQQNARVCFYGFSVLSTCLRARAGITCACLINSRKNAEYAVLLAMRIVMTERESERESAKVRRLIGNRACNTYIRCMALGKIDVLEMESKILRSEARVLMVSLLGLEVSRPGCKNNARCFEKLIRRLLLLNALMIWPACCVIGDIGITYENSWKIIQRVVIDTH